MWRLRGGVRRGVARPRGPIGRGTSADRSALGTPRNADFPGELECAHTPFLRELERAARLFSWSHCSDLVIGQCRLSQ